MNKRPVGGRSSETSSHPIDMTIIVNVVLRQFHPPPLLTTYLHNIYFNVNCIRSALVIITILMNVLNKAKQSRYTPRRRLGGEEV
jgi:hypothetical protein